MEGGYQIIDLKNKPLKSLPTRMDGIYEAVEGTRKPLLIQNIVMDNENGTTTEYRDFFGSANVSGDSFTISDYSQGIIVYVELNGSNQSVVSLDFTNVSASTGDVTSLIMINDTLEIDQDGALGVASE